MKKSNTVVKRTFLIVCLCSLTAALQATIRYVKPAASGSGNGSSWANASSDLNAILWASVSGDEVWVAAGTYKPTRDAFNNSNPADPRNKIFYIREGVKLYGGFAGTETLLSQRVIGSNPVFLDGNIGSSGTNTDNCYHVILAVNNTANVNGVTIDGFTIRNGKAESAGGSVQVNGETINAAYGAAMQLHYGNNNLANLTISNNEARSGGGIYCNGSGSLTITNSSISANFASELGAGLYVQQANVALSNTLFSGNLALQSGGGILAVNCSALTFSNSNFSGNSSLTEDGGGVKAEGTPVTLTNVNASSNSARRNGGFLYSNNSTVIISRGNINNNSSSNSGGAMYVSGNGSFELREAVLSGNNTNYEGGALFLLTDAVLENDTITGNTQLLNQGFSSGGGGISLFSGNNSIRNSVITNNNSAQGGGIRQVGNGSLLLSGNYITGNSSASNGGGIYINGSSLTMINNVVAGNSALQGGGGIYFTGQDAKIHSSTIVSNTSTTSGSGIYKGSANTFDITNTVLWDNKLGGSGTAPGADIFNNSAAFNSLTVRNSLLQLPASSYTTTGNGNYDIGTAAAGNLYNINPLFFDLANITGADGLLRTADDGLYPVSSSPLLNAGNNTLLPAGLTTDIAGGGRILGSNTDIGSYEYYTCVTGLSRRYVNAGASTAPAGPAAGTTWALAYTSLADALEAARNCSSINEIWIAKGTYKPTMAYPGINNPADARDKTFCIPLNVKIYGGFAGTETSLTQRNTVANETILSGDIGTVNNNSDNCYHVLVASSSNAVIDGFTIRDGNANGNNSVSIAGNTISRISGGAIVLAGGNNKVKNNIITDNNALNGGGINTSSATDTIINNFFTANTVTLIGGAIYSSLSTEFIANNLFWNNSASAGGGFYSNRSTTHFISNTFFANTASGNAGALFTLDGSGRFSNTVFWMNTKGGSGSAPGADYYNNSSVIDNNLFKNTLLQLNAADYSTAGLGNYDLGSTASGNLFATDPLFKQPANVPGPDGILRTADDGLMPDACSPVINAGNNSLIPAVITTDIANNARIQLTTTDIGSYEVAGIAPVNIANSNLSVTKLQGASTQYTNDCSTLIALVSSSGSNPVSGITTARIWIEPAPPASFVKRHYEITPAANAATATGRVTLYFTQQDFTDFNATNVIKLPVNAADAANHKANLRIEKRSGTSNNGSGLPGSYTGSITVIDPVDADIVWNNASGRWEVSFDVTGFSGFFVKTTSGILPVTWISFNGTLNTNKQAVLNWNVEEQNVIHYQVEKSADGASFANAGNLNSLGDGHHSYTFTDATPLSGRAFYRIRQTDRDGRFSYSAVIMLKNENRGVLSVFPNPFTSHIQVHSSTAQTILLYDLSGRTIRTIAVLPGTTSVNLATLAKGTYLLKSAEGDRIKLVKNE